MGRDAPGRIHGAAQRSAERVNRVWAYFQPDPIDARARKPVAISTTASDRGWAITWTTPFAASAGYLGWATLASASPVSVLTYLVALGAGYFGLRNALEWHYRALRLRAKELAHSGRLRASGAGEFATQVERSIKHYFAKYAPKKLDRDVWLTATARIRAAMRDEIADLYGESEISVTRVHWLIRHMVGDVTRRWAKGTLREYRKRWRTRPATKLWCLLSFAVFGLAVTGVVVVAVRVDPVRGAGAALVLMLSGMLATRRWSRISHEERRFADESLEHERTLADRRAAYQRWCDKLKCKPEESEMETWLTCDKTTLLDKALKHYKLAWRDVIAHAFLQTPAARNYKKARTNNCPWRYAKYDMRLFLITQDGVREYRAEFDFEKVEITRNERNNFRFDAVSSVGVISTSELSYTLKLALNNGPANDIRVIDAETRQPETGDEDSEEFSQLNLDAAGFTPTLHILEGIAAEGKGWLQRDPQFCGTSAGVSSAIDGF